MSFHRSNASKHKSRGRKSAAPVGTPPDSQGDSQGSSRSGRSSQPYHDPMLPSTGLDDDIDSDQDVDSRGYQKRPALVDFGRVSQLPLPETLTDLHRPAPTQPRRTTNVNIGTTAYLLISTTVPPVRTSNFSPRRPKSTRNPKSTCGGSRRTPEQSSWRERRQGKMGARQSTLLDLTAQPGSAPRSRSRGEKLSVHTTAR